MFFADRFQLRGNSLVVRYADGTGSRRATLWLTHIADGTIKSPGAGHFHIAAGKLLNG
jgi:hypothetical protein